jgi:tetratricopeptide (TPR) repeat protein
MISKKKSKSIHKSIDKSLRKGFSRSLEPMGLSVCLIVKNEEQHLSKCLNSVKSIADEIILVDTGSSDRTVSFAKKHKAKIFHFPWCDDFSKARNYAIAQATGQWILVIDADEILEQEAIAVLQSVMANDDCLAANLLRTESGTNKVPLSYVLRLFRNHPEVQFWGCYHESIDQSITKLQERESHWLVFDVDTPVLHHHGYTASEIQRKQKYIFAKRLMTKHLQSFPDDIYMHSKLGALYISAMVEDNTAEARGDLSLGLQILQRGLSLANHGEEFGLTYFDLLFHLGLAYEYSGESELAQEAYLQAIALNVTDRVKFAAYTNLGGIYQENKQPESLACFAKVIEIVPDYAPGYLNYGIALKTTGRYEEAIAAYKQAIALVPNYAQAYQELGAVLFKIGDFQTATANITVAIKLHRQQGDLTTADNLQEVLQGVLTALT